MKNRRGFTLIEFVLIIAVALILATAAIVAINNAVKSIRLTNAADKLASDLRYAQYMAGNTATWYGISLEADPVNQYSIYTTDGSVDALVSDPAKPGSNFVVPLNTDYNILISGVTIEGGGKHIEFSPSGAPYADKNNTNPISTESVVTLSNGSATRTVRITPNTGRVYEQ